MSSASEKRWFAAVASLENCVLCGRSGVQVSHSNMLRGMGQKSAEWNTAALCPDCHFEIDSGRDLGKSERRALHFRAITLTHDRLIRAGRLVLK
jgi:hypothetical protein